MEEVEFVGDGPGSMLFFFRAAPIAILSSEASKVGLSLGSEHFVAL